MIDFNATNDTSINAPPQAVFEIVGDLSRHKNLAGSGELVRVRKLTEGPTRLGSMIEADESIHLGDQNMEFSAWSIVVGYNTTNTISWISNTAHTHTARSVVIPPDSTWTGYKSCT